MSPQNATRRKDAELSPLLQQLQALAQDILKEEPGFPPFGGIVNAAGQVALVTDQTSASRAASAEGQRDAVVTALRRMARQETLLAAGVTYMGTIDQSGRDVDAIVSSVHHHVGTVVDVILPYIRHADGTISYGEFSVQPGNVRLLG